MLFDSISNAHLYTQLPGLAPALAFLQSLEGKLPPARIELEGGRLWANPVRLTTKPHEECKYEAHRRYIDVHYIISGVEGIAMRPTAQLTPLSEFDEEADIGFYIGSPHAVCYLHPGQFMVCWPEDAHQVCMMHLSPSPVEKVVVKIPVEYGLLPTRRVMIFGDSNTYGYDPGTDDRYDAATRFPGRLQRLLGSDVQIIAEGLPGRTTVFDDPPGGGLCGIEALAPLMLAHNPLDTLIIMLGTNDCKARFGCTSANIGKGLARLVDSALVTLAWRAAPDILLVCPPAIQPEYAQGLFAAEMGPGAHLRAAGLGAEYAQVADQKGCRFIDAGRLPGVTMHPLDGMHLTAQAHNALANVLAGMV